MSKVKRGRSSFAMLFLHAHHLFLIGVGIVFGIGGVASGVDHWNAAKTDGKNPLSDPYVQGAATLVGAVVLCIAIIVLVIYKEVRARLKEIEGDDPMVPGAPVKRSV